MARLSDQEDLPFDAIRLNLPVSDSSRATNQNEVAFKSCLGTLGT